MKSITLLLAAAVAGSVSSIHTGISVASQHSAIHHHQHDVVKPWGCSSVMKNIRGGSTEDDDINNGKATTTTAKSTSSIKPTKIPSGGAESKYLTQLEVVKEQVVASAMSSVSYLKYHLLK
jgi:hypothetical protein